MQTEIEAKFTHIDPAVIRALLPRVGARHVQPERLMRRRTYDFPSATLDAQHAWARVRDEGDKITMSYKQNQDESLHGTVEVNLIVDSYESADAFLRALGLVQKSEQETKRESWLLGSVEVTIDTWPWIPPFVEIEGPSEAGVRATALHGGVATVYQMHYDVTADEVNSCPVINFQSPAMWPQRQHAQT